MTDHTDPLAEILMDAFGFIPGDTEDPYRREDFRDIADAVRAAVISGELQPQALGFTAMDYIDCPFCDPYGEEPEHECVERTLYAVKGPNDD